MAAPFHQREVGGGSTQYDGSRGSVQSHLPNGGCNFRELTLGARAPVCGCKRFWLNGSALGAQDKQDFCFCGHHACFHHIGSQTPSAPVHAAVSAVQDEAARHVRGRNTPDGYYAVHNAGAGASPKPSTGLGIQADFPSQSRSINTRMWDALNGFARHQDAETASVTTSKLPSTAVPSINGDAIPPYQHRSMGPPLNIPSLSLARAGLDEYMGSATEVATPSVAGTPDLQAFIPPGYPPRSSPARLFAGQPLDRMSTPTPQQQQPEIASATNQLLSRDVENMLQSYGRRLDVLETLSFSHVPVEEVQDKFENFDDRLLDVEQWRSERDQEREQESLDRTSDSAREVVGKRRRLLPDQLSFSSSASFDSAAAMHTEAAVLATVATNLELEPRFEALENRVMDLENAAMPSFARPWEVQVVLLPWGSELRGIWFTSSDATQQSQRSALQSSAEWTGPKTAPKVSFQSSASTAWTTESIEAWAEDAQDWLSPKACGPAGDVFQRLASRGLVRDLTFTSSSSKHVWDTITTAFRRVLPEKPAADSDLLDQYQGLHARFLPLRKIRKSTRLRFLNPAEMVTSASWTADLLESSAMMKVNDGQRRLYITTPHAYLQNRVDKWTWKTLKDLPARDELGEVQSRIIGRSVAIEACWSYNDKLDYIPSMHSSFGSRASHKSQGGDFSVHHQIQDQPMSPLSDARPLRHRTISSSLPNYETAALALKRRAASFETLINAPTSSDPPSLATAKRARLSISPEAERRGVGFTPRLSREPPSPFHSDVHMVDSRSQGAASKRGTTPFAYATPHSNSTIIGMAGLQGCGDDDTVLGTDLADEEWQGVGDAFEDEQDDGEEEEDDDDGESIESGDNSAYSDTDVDEEEGMTIYEF
jgi:hypothetical protein